MLLVSHTSAKLQGPSIRGERKAVLEGEPIRGTWFNRTEAYRARLLRKKKGSEPESLSVGRDRHALCNCPAGVTSVRRCSGIWWRLVYEIESDAAAERKLTGREPLGPQAILSQHPQTHPEKLKKSLAPLFHAVRKDARLDLPRFSGQFSC